MGERWTPRRQGDAGELSAMVWLTSQGATVFIPVGHSPHVDLVADFGDELVRVQVKTSTSRYRHRWYVSVCTRGGNQSWNGLVKHIDRSRCDYLFAHTGDGRRWYIPTGALEAETKLALGGPKYSEYEIDPGEPLQSRATTSQGAGS